MINRTQSLCTTPSLDSEREMREEIAQEKELKSKEATGFAPLVESTPSSKPEPYVRRLIWRG